MPRRDDVALRHHAEVGLGAGLSARRVANADELRAAEHRGLAVTKLEVEPPADGENRVRITHHGAAHGGDN